MRLTALTLEDCEQVRKWRNEDISAYRTPYLLGDIMQADFYKNVVSSASTYILSNFALSK